MDPVTAGLFVAAGFAASLYTSKNQARVEAASINLEVEQARLQASERAYERTKAYREEVSANLALSGMGVGGIGGYKAVLSDSSGSLGADLKSIGTGASFAMAQGQAAYATSKSNRFRRDLDATMTAASLAGDLGLFSPKTTKKAK